MANILLTWEAGAGLGHLVNLRPFARHLTDGGHRVFAALQDLSRAQSVFQAAPVEFLQAPIRVRFGADQIRVPQTFAQILHNLSFSDARELAALTTAWRHLYSYVKPDLIVFDHSPTALLASRGLETKRVLVGTGFFSPPHVAPMPNLRPSTPTTTETLLAHENTVLDRVNRLVTDWGEPPLEKLSDLYAQVDFDYLATFPELDHYPERQGGKYIGAWPGGVGKPPVWPSGNGPRIYAYLKPFAAIESLLSLLAKVRHPTLVYVDGVDRKLQERYRSDLLYFEDQPLELGRVARECDLAILNANHGTTVAMLLAGTPTLQIPLYLEQSLFAAAVARMGAGLAAPPGSEEMINQRLHAVLADDRYREAAGQFAQRYANFDPEGQIDCVMSQLEDLLAGRTPTVSPGIDGQVVHGELATLDPRALVHPKRFDLMAKHIYARHRELLVKCDWARKLYLEHLRVLNGFYEAAPRKEKADDFLTAFNDLLDSIKRDGYLASKKPVPLGRDGSLINGSHRVAACLAFGRPVTCEVYQQPGLEFSSAWFRRTGGDVSTGLPTWCGDAMALEYCLLRDDALLVIFLPDVDVDDKVLLRELKSHGTIVYGKRAMLSPRGFNNLLVHRHLTMATSDSEAVANNKPILRPLRVFVFQADASAAADQVSQSVANNLAVARDSILVSYRSDQTRQFAQLVLHDLSIDRLNQALSVDTRNLPMTLQRLSRRVEKQGIELDRYCLGGSAVLAAHGLGSVDKLEVICRPADVLPDPGPDVGFLTDTSERYGKPVDEILFDASNHFFAYGVKFAAWPLISYILRACSLPTDVGELAQSDSSSLLRLEEHAAIQYARSKRQ